MGNSASKLYMSDAMQRYEPIVSEVGFTLASGVPTICAGQLGYPIYAGSTATPFTQALVDAFLGIASDLVATTTFDSTSMATDVFGFVINCGGQAKSALWAEGILSLVITDPGAVGCVTGNGTGTTTIASAASTAAFSVTAGGNLYGRMVTEGYDGAGGTFFIIRAAWLPK